MDKCIDLYSRLIIATITFVGPFIILLLSNFNSGEKRRKELLKTSVEEITKRAKQELKNSDNITEILHKNSEEIKKIEKDNKNELSRLNPVIQFWIIYGFLAFSFVTLCIGYLVKDKHLNLYNHELSLSIFTLSIISYLISIFFIIRTFNTIIKTKKITES